jgi:hypothetical protein
MPLVTVLSLFAAFLSHVPWRQLEDLAVDVVEGRASRDEFERVIPAVIDASIPFDQLVPGGLGAFLEKIDGQAFKLLVGWIADVAEHRAKARKAPTADSPERGFAAWWSHLFGPKGAPAPIAGPA